MFREVTTVDYQSASCQGLWELPADHISSGKSHLRGKGAGVFVHQARQPLVESCRVLYEWTGHLPAPPSRCTALAARQSADCERLSHCNLYWEGLMGYGWATNHSCCTWGSRRGESGSPGIIPSHSDLWGLEKQRWLQERMEQV